MSEAEEQSKAIEVKFPLIFLRTKRGIQLMERLGRMKLTRVLAWILLVVVPISAALFMFLILNVVIRFLSDPFARALIRDLGPQANFLIPGLNPYVPVLYGWVAIVTGLIVHEGGHGILARSLNLPVKSSGLMLLLGLPIGAFVEIDDKELAKARLRDSGRVLAAGPGNNIVAGSISLVALLLLVSSMTPMVVGVGVLGVLEGYPPAEVGILPGDVIQELNGRTIPDIQTLTLVRRQFAPGDEVIVKIMRDSDFLSYTLKLASDPNDKSVGFLGIIAQDFKNTANNYLASPALFFAPPTFPGLGNSVPFSPVLERFFTSPMGVLTHPLANLLYWIWFVNINLALFNALPIYPLDGGQMLRFSLRRVCGGRLSERLQMRLTIATTLTVVGLIAIYLIIPYVMF